MGWHFLPELNAGNQSHEQEVWEYQQWFQGKLILFHRVNLHGTSWIKIKHCPNSASWTTRTTRATRSGSLQFRTGSIHTKIIYPVLFLNTTGLAWGAHRFTMLCFRAAKSDSTYRRHPKLGPLSARCSPWSVRNTLYKALSPFIFFWVTEVVWSTSCFAS